MKKWLIVLCLSQAAYVFPTLPQAVDKDEELFLKRVLHFWETGDYEMAKHLMQSYLHDHSESSFADYFYNMLGDIFLKQKDYEQALSSFNKVRSLDFLPELRTKKYQALYLLERFSDLYKLAKEEKESLTKEELFYLAESCYKIGLACQSNEETKSKAASLFQEAIPLYAALANDEPYCFSSKLAIAELAKLDHDFAKAFAFYSELHQEKKDPNLLFQAALCLQEIEEKKAFKLYEELANQGYRPAFLHWIKELARKEKWQELAKNRNLFLSFSDDEAQSVAYYYLGLAALSERHHLQVVLDLTKSLGKGLKPPLEREAILTLMGSAKEIGRTEACEKCLALLKSSYPGDVPDGLYLQSQCFLKAKDKKKALEVLSELLTQFPNHPLSEKACYEKIELLTKLEEWKQARDEIRRFYERYPHSSHTKALTTLAVDIALKQMDQPDALNDLADGIQRGLACKAFEDEKEKQTMLAKAYLQLGKSDYALQVLSSMSEPDPLLLTECYVNLGKEPEKIIQQGERALAENPDVDLIHFHLFNAYSSLYARQKDSRMRQKAAFHLSAIMDRHAIPFENRVWLAHYYAKEDKVKAISILESFLQTEQDLSDYYKEALLLADLYKKEDKDDQASFLLEKMLHMKGGSEPEAELRLADLYFERGSKEQAEKLYKKLEEAHHSFVSAKATLQSARLEFFSDPEKALKKFYSLVENKNLGNEPIHLEAAIDYAEFAATLDAPDKQEESLLEHLIEIKDLVLSQETPSAKAYHASRMSTPEKDTLYQAHMRYLDARIYQVQSRFAVDAVERKVKFDQAQILLSSLCKGKYAVSDYLSEKAREKLREE